MSERDDNEAGTSIPFLLARPSRPSLAPARPRNTNVPEPPPVAKVTTVTQGWTAPLGLLVIGLLVLVSVFADLLSSDLPIVCKVHDSVYVLPCITRPPPVVDAKFRAPLPGEWAVAALVAHGPGPSDAALRGPWAVPTHPLGTDTEGRDMFAVVVHGTRSYLGFALLSVLAVVLLGASMGAVAGYFRGAFDDLLSRVVESLSAFPPLVLIIGIQAAVDRPSVLTLFLAIGLTRWPEFARLVRAEVLFASTQDYVTAARALGAAPLRILVRHVAPNVGGVIAVTAALSIGGVILTEAAVDFLGLGAQAGSASWGQAMGQFRTAPDAWWLLFFPGLMLFALVLGHNVVGERLRRAFDPRATD
ncbi:MAG: ABC transporter permease [Myxococcales bacterium]|nr:ABC transporter permease [Myxococcales bacterium]